METLNHSETPEKDVPLRYDIRLLGRILGDTVRAQEGEAVFDLVEHIRRTGVQFHRNADEAARQELQAIMSGLPTDQAIRIIRAFGYFSHLANIAEDQHHIRRTRAYAMAKAPPRRGTMAYALGARPRRRHLAPSSLQAFFATALCMPGADRAPDRGPAQEHRSTARWRSPGCSTSATASHFTPEELAANRKALRRAVLTLWQTSLLRGTRLRVHRRGRQRARLLRPHLPARAAALLRRPRGPARRRRSGLARARVPSFLRMGSWIGGDRDGNPFVTADVTAPGAAPCRASGRSSFYLEELHLLGASCRSTAAWCEVSPKLAARWPSARPTTRPSARTSPTGAPSPASTRAWRRPRWALDRLEPPHPPVGPAPAYDAAAELQADLDVDRTTR